MTIDLPFEGTDSTWVLNESIELLVWANQNALASWRIDPSNVRFPIDLSEILGEAVLSTVREALRASRSPTREIKIAWPDLSVGPGTTVSATATQLDSRAGGCHVILTSSRTSLKLDTVTIDHALPDDSKISVFTLDGELIVCNTTAKKFYGEDGHTLHDHFSIDYNIEEFLLSIKEDKEIETVIEIPGRDKEEIYHLLKARILHGRESECRAILFCEIDITKPIQSSYNTKISQNYLLLENLNKIDFVAAASHELRTPMTGVLGLAEIIHRLTSEQSIRDLATRLIDSGKDLLEVCDHLTDLVELAKDDLSPDETDFRPGKIIQAATEAHGAFAKARQIKLSAMPGYGADIIHRGDPHRVYQVVSNLVSDAIVSSEGDTITLGAETTSDNRALVFTIHDNGANVSFTRNSRSFGNRTYSAKHSHEERRRNWLKTMAAKELLHKMNGRLEVYSRPNEPSSLRVLIPLPALSSQSSVKEPNEKETLTSFPGINVLVIDHHIINRDVFIMLLQSLDVKVMSAATSEEAINLYSIHKFDAVMVDISMPYISGVDLLRSLREIESIQNREPAIMVSATAHTMSHEILAYQEAGFDAHLPKPIRLAAVIRLFQTHSISNEAKGHVLREVSNRNIG